MAQQLVLYVAYEPAQGRPVGLARLTDRDLLSKAAETAISDARRRAEVAAAQDPILGQIQADEACRLERYLRQFVLGPSLVSAAPAVN